MEKALFIKLISTLIRCPNCGCPIEVKMSDTPMDKCEFHFKCNCCNNYIIATITRYDHFIEYEARLK